MLKAYAIFKAAPVMERYTHRYKTGGELKGQSLKQVEPRITTLWIPAMNW